MEGAQSRDRPPADEEELLLTGGLVHALIRSSEGGSCARSWPRRGVSRGPLVGSDLLSSFGQPR